MNAILCLFAGKLHVENISEVPPHLRVLKWSINVLNILWSFARLQMARLWHREEKCEIERVEVKGEKQWMEMEIQRGRKFQSGIQGEIVCSVLVNTPLSMVCFPNEKQSCSAKTK